MADPMSAQEKLALIKENLQEVLKEDIIEDVILKQNRPLKIYWGKGFHKAAPPCYAHLWFQVLRRPEDPIADTSSLWSSLLTSCAPDVP